MKVGWGRFYDSCRWVTRCGCGTGHGRSETSVEDIINGMVGPLSCPRGPRLVRIQVLPAKNGVFHRMIAFQYVVDDTHT